MDTFFRKVKNFFSNYSIDLNYFTYDKLLF